MKRRVAVMGLMLAVGQWVHGQAPVIGAGDMFNEVGLYYRAHANGTDSLAAANRMGTPGENRFWDFTQGPTDRVLRFDYMSPTGLVEATDFPLATLAEQKTVEGVGEMEWIFFEQVPAVGRRVYGFYSEQYSPGTPSIPFSQPIVDFPDTIAYLNTWQTSFTTVSSFPSGDTEEDPFLGDFLLQTTWNSTFTADAWGIVLLPSLGLVDALRINEEQIIDIAADLGDGWQHIASESIRSYYWLSPGRGIVAQMTSIPGESGMMPTLNFATAAAFVRMFETNKEGGSGSTDPQPVTNLRVTVSNGLVLIQWSKAANATSYKVEYSPGSMGPGSWQTLGNTSDDFLFDNDGFGQASRFYRVESLR